MSVTLYATFLVFFLSIHIGRSELSRRGRFVIRTLRYVSISVIKTTSLRMVHYSHGCFEMDIRLLIRIRMYITVQLLPGSHRSSLKCG